MKKNRFIQSYNCLLVRVRFSGEYSPQCDTTQSAPQEWKSPGTIRGGIQDSQSRASSRICIPAQCTYQWSVGNWFWIFDLFTYPLPLTRTRRASISCEQTSNFHIFWENFYFSLFPNDKRYNITTTLTWDVERLRHKFWIWQFETFVVVLGLVKFADQSFLDKNPWQKKNVVQIGIRKAYKKGFFLKKQLLSNPCT